MKYSDAISRMENGQPKYKALSMNDGGPAFPRTASFTGDEQDGMSLRDAFAAAAITGIWAGCPQGADTDNIACLPLNSWARCAYAQADAMVREREKKP